MSAPPKVVEQQVNQEGLNQRSDLKYDKKLGQDESLPPKEISLTTFLPGYQSHVKQPLQSGYRGNLHSASDAGSDYDDNQYLTAAPAASSLAVSSPKAVLPAFQQKKQVAANPKVDASELDAFLKFVAKSEHDQAESMLKKN